MTIVSPAHEARGARLTELATTTITRAIKVGSTSRHDGKYLSSAAEMHESPDGVRASRVASRPREVTGSFVDFLLGRGARYRR
jgi:hypothetical protein